MTKKVKSDIEQLKANLVPVEGDSVVFRILNEGGYNFLEFKGDFFRAVQRQLRLRVVVK